MPIHTFRTEGPGDAERAEVLIAELDLSILKHWKEKAGPNWPVDFYTVESDIEDTEVLRDMMRGYIESDPRFADLHRCWETLNDGPESKSPFS